MAMWNPWRGCKKCSDGCLHCYIHKGDIKRNVNTNEIVKTKDFQKPIEKLKNGNYKMKSGIVYTCFSTDFLVEEADEWRKDCWKMIKERQDCTFLFITKRIDRFMKCIPNDWNDGYDNVVVCCTIENQKNADKSLEGNVLSGLGNAGKAIGNLAEKVKVKNVDSWLNEKSKNLTEAGQNIKENFIIKFEELKNSNSKSFINQIEKIDLIYNKTKEIYFDNEKIYLESE